MEQIITISVISTAAFMGGGIWLFWLQEKVTKKRNDYRMGQALRRGLTNPTI